MNHCSLEHARGIKPQRSYGRIVTLFSIRENFNEFRFSIRAGHFACRNCYQIFSDDIRIMKRVFGRHSAIFRQMPSYTSGKQAALASDRGKRTNALFICSRSAANRIASVGRSQSMIARVQFAICVCAYARCTLTRAQKFSSRRVRLRRMRGRFYKFAGVGFCYGHYRLHANACDVTG